MNDRRTILIGGPVHGLHLAASGDVQSCVLLGPDGERVDYTWCPSAQTGDHYVLVAPTVEIVTRVTHIGDRGGEQARAEAISKAVARLISDLGPVLWGPRVSVEPTYGKGFTIRVIALGEKGKNDVHHHD